jgi:DNA repair exonuclease SbcCD nuclease subunit
MTPELVEFVAWILTECAKISKTIVIIGNHDFLENNNTRLDALTPIIDSLKNDNIVYYKNRGVYEDENINWCVYSLMEHNIQPDIQKSKNKNIGLFHGPITGLYTDIGYKFEDGFDVSKFKGCDLVLCGDIHKRQVFDIPGGKKAYMDMVFMILTKINTTLLIYLTQNLSYHSILTQSIIWLRELRNL